MIYRGFTTRILPAVIAAAVASAAGAQTTWYVDDDNYPNPGSGTPADPFCFVQDAIDAAADSDEILVAPGTYGEAIDLLGKLVNLHSSDGPAVTIIDATGLDASVVKCITGETPDTMVEGFTFTGGTGTQLGEETRGGGMYINNSSPSVTNCTFSDNEAGSGGGLYIFGASAAPTISKCRFVGNYMTHQGAVLVTGAGNAVLVDCWFEDNETVGYGGGMANTNSHPTLINCVFVGNVAPMRGSGMNNYNSSPTVINCTFYNNQGSGANGVIWNGYGGTLTMTNCILWNPGVEIKNYSGGGATVSYCDVEFGYSGPGNINADPMFVDPDNGGFQLSPGSPCIDAGDNAAVPAWVTTDLDGNPRFVNDLATDDTGNGDPPIVDLGAYEFEGSLPCPWDCQAVPDGSIGVNDFLQLLADWGGPSPCDFDGNDVEVTDFLALLAHWGSCP